MWDIVNASSRLLSESGHDREAVSMGLYHRSLVLPLANSSIKGGAGAVRRILVRTVATVLLLVLGVIGAELLAQGYAYFIVEKGKRFQPDERLGWILIPNLEIRRKNANGETYRIQTDALSIRGPSRFPESMNIRRMLVVGDSFAFGEGVNLEDRFDTLLMELVFRL